jgi:hypothetical protein
VIDSRIFSFIISSLPVSQVRVGLFYLMLKEKIVIVDVSKKSKIVSEVLPPPLRKSSTRKCDWSARAPSARSTSYSPHK